MVDKLEVIAHCDGRHAVIENLPEGYLPFAAFTDHHDDIYVVVHHDARKIAGPASQRLYSVQQAFFKWMERYAQNRPFRSSYYDLAGKTDPIVERAERKFQALVLHQEKTLSIAGGYSKRENYDVFVGVQGEVMKQAEDVTFEWREWFRGAKPVPRHEDDSYVLSFTLDGKPGELRYTAKRKVGWLELGPEFQLDDNIMLLDMVSIFPFDLVFSR
ncbi:hypothetical protein KY331_05955 [Candidatus Woesearchaeota archaeon]|nr:hypothetical protein [Candidatus Woesearchaeota archaeon]